MTLQQLFREVEFEDLIPHLLEKGPKSKGNLARFNEAFDIARRMKNVASDGETIMVEFTEGSSAKVESVCFCDDNYWHFVLDRTISDYEKFNCDKNQLAAAALWELTFYGFNEDEIDENFRDTTGEVTKGSLPLNKYARAYHRLNIKWGSVLKTKKDIALFIKRMSGKIGMNGPKRKREHRQRKRMQQLKRYSKIEDLCQMIRLENVVGIASAELWANIKTNSFQIVNFRSVAENPNDSCAYIIRGFEKYIPTNRFITDRFIDVSKSFIFISGNEVAKQGINNLIAACKERFPNPSFGVGTNDNDYIKVKAILVLKSSAGK